MNNDEQKLIDLNKTEIEIRRVKTGGEIIAQAKIIFDKMLTIRGFKIVKSQKDGKNYSVFPPSFEARGKYYDIWWLDNKELWNKIEEKIIAEFEQKEIEEGCKNVFEEDNTK